VSEDIPILVLRALSTKVVTVFCTGIKQITTGALAASASLNLSFWRLVSWLTVGIGGKDSSRFWTKINTSV
jgi:hypothetical protein